MALQASPYVAERVFKNNKSKSAFIKSVPSVQSVVEKKSMVVFVYMELTMSCINLCSRTVSSFTFFRDFLCSFHIFFLTLQQTQIVHQGKRVIYLIGKRTLRTLSSTCRSRKSKHIQEDAQPERPHWVYCIQLLPLHLHCNGITVISNITRRGLSRVAYPCIWAMREPTRGISEK